MDEEAAMCLPYLERQIELVKPDVIVDLATLIGYADGYPRALGNKGFGFIAEQRVALVGRVSMDLTTFDVTGIPEDAAHPGAMIELIGRKAPIDEVAEAAGTIAYEILTGLGPRFHRQYLGGGQAA